jgi:iron complex transport system substrate-binding protein
MSTSRTPLRAQVRVALLLTSLLAALALAACGGADSDSNDNAGAADAAAAFPVTITHALGDTTIRREPKRVVALGWSDQDPLLALGVKPVGTIEWFDEQPGAIFPWAKKAAAGSVPKIVGTAGDIDFEKVAALRPDLILALYEGLDAKKYATLSKIAPTVAHSPKYDPFGATWQDMTLTAGRAVGREPRAKQLIAGVEARFATIRREHAEWADQTALVMADLSGGNYSVFSPQDPKVRLFAQLGFKTTPPWLSPRVKDNVAQVSAEQVRLLDVDRLAWTSDPATLKRIRADKLYNRLDVVRDGRVSYLDYTKPPFPGAAVTFNSVLSIPYALDRVVPELAADGAK